MGNLHRITLGFLRELKAFVPAHTSMLQSCHVRDDSMAPTLEAGSIIKIDTGMPVRKGLIVAIATDTFIEMRELQIHRGGFYLVPHNEKYPTISMKDFRALYPDSFFYGVVVQDVLNNKGRVPHGFSD